MSDSSKREFTTFVGIDLGGGKGKNTAVAVLRRSDRGATVRYVGTKTSGGKPFYDQEILSFLAEQPGDMLLAIDAPLRSTACMRCRLPKCVGLSACEDPTIQWFRRNSAGIVDRRSRVAGKPAATPYTQRACELVVRRDLGLLPRETLGQGMGPLTARAHYLSRALEGRFSLNSNMIEVYPKATIHVLFGGEFAKRYKRQVDTWKIRAQMLEKLSATLHFEVWREGCLSNDHCFDAVICAYTGFLWASEHWSLPVQDRAVFEEDGWIWYPPKDEPSG